MKKIMHDIKNRAAKMQKEPSNEKTYMQCLHAASVEAGYRSWADVLDRAKKEGHR